MRKWAWTSITESAYRRGNRRTDRGVSLPKLAVVMTPDRVADVCGPDARQLLDDRFEVSWAGADLSPAAAEKLVVGSDVVLTSWGTPQLEKAWWDGGNGPKVVAHAAGSVKKLVDPAILE